MAQPKPKTLEVPKVRNSSTRYHAEIGRGEGKPQVWITQSVIAIICIAWSGYQLYIAYEPVNATIARSWHLGFAILLAYLCYPRYSNDRSSFFQKYIFQALPISFSPRTLRRTSLIVDIILGVVASLSAIYIWWDYEGVISRQGIPSTTDVYVGVVMILLLLEASRRALGLALPIICIIFLAYSFLGPYMPELLRHRGIPLDYVINDQFLSTTGIFGIPIGVSTDFVFLFVLFGAFLDRAGAGKYFIDIAFSGLGWMQGGPAKASVVASGLTGMVSGSSIANTVTTGTFTIPLMKKVGLPAYKASAIEVAASTNGQLMPPIMGAAAFIMAEIIGIPYLDVVRAALIPALISYLALFYVVHLESRKLGIKKIPRSELPAFLKTFLGGLHYIIPILVLIFYLVILRRSPITSVLFAIEALTIIILIQRPIICWISWHKGNDIPRTDESLSKALFISFCDGIRDVYLGLITGARNMVAVGVATASAGIIVGVVTSTGLVGRFVTLIDTISMGNIYLMLILTAITSIILGMGLPTTANYIVMATLTAPIIVTLGSDSGIIIPIIAAHLFVFYFGILADDTPPVGLAAYAAAAIGRSDPIKTGIQGFTYDLRTAILPFVFLFNTDLLMIDGISNSGDILWINDPIRLVWIFFVSLIAMFAFAASIQGFFAKRCTIYERVFLLIVCLILFRPTVLAEPLELSRELVQVIGLFGCASLYALQRFVWSKSHEKS